MTGQLHVIGLASIGLTTRKRRLIYSYNPTSLFSRNKTNIQIYHLGGHNLCCFTHRKLKGSGIYSRSMRPLWGQNNKFLPPIKKLLEVNTCNNFIRVYLSLHSGRKRVLVTITYDPLDLTVQDPPALPAPAHRTPLYRDSWAPPHVDMRPHRAATDI